MSTGRDIRMRGFASRKLVREALNWIDLHACPISESELVDLIHCRGRVLAETVHAPMSVPEFPRSAMDGYALIGAETTGAGDYNPIAFRLLGDAFPGRPFLGKVSPGTAVRIMTGAPLPDGADAVLPVEFAQESQPGSGSPEGADSGDLSIPGVLKRNVEALAAVAPSKNVGWRGEDIAEASELLLRGRRLRPQDAAILASVGITNIPVLRRPTVAIFTTGNELVPPGAERQPFQIFDANSTLLRCLVERDEGQIIEWRWIEDDARVLRQALSNTRADIILVSGGSSVGVEDHAPSLIKELGTLDLHGLAMRPSSPAGMGRINSSLVFLLPGNPVSCLCAYDFFARRAIYRLAGRPPEWQYPVRSAKLARKLVSAIGRLDYVRVQFQDGQIEPLAISGASILSSTVRADGFVLVPEDLEGYPAGAEVDVYLYDAN